MVDRKRTSQIRSAFLRSGVAAVFCLALAASGIESASAQTATATSAQPLPVAPPIVRPVGNPAAIGKWRELILNANGTINRTEYRRVAANYNSAEILDYRLGPKAADFGNTTNTAPTTYAPDPTGYGLWPYGTLPARNPGEPEKCVRSENLPGSDQEELRRGLKGNGWLVGGHHLFLPDNANDPDYKFGIANTRGADGVVFDTGGLCMRMRASSEYDWWNRNNIANPGSPEVREAAAARPDLPLGPVALARSRTNSGQIAFAAFKDGTILPVVTGNGAPEYFDASGIKLPAGMVPTAMAVTPSNEFLVVTVWDTKTVTGKLAFIALRPREMAVGNPDQTPNTRWYWGLPGAWTVRGMKLLGMISLPFAAPTSVDVSNNLAQGNPRGNSDNDDPAVGDLSLPSARKLWADVHPVNPTKTISAAGPDAPYVNNEWSQAASAGYAIVASRAENRVSIVNMAPLYQYYRKMYLTTQARYNLTADTSLTNPKKWPYSFAVAPGQRPGVTKTFTIERPTAVSAGVQGKGASGDRSDYIFEYLSRSPKTDWSGYLEPERYLGRSRAYIAQMDGTVRIMNVQGLNLPGSPVGPTVPETPLATFKAGRNPSFAFTNTTSTAVDDLFLVSRGDRSVTYAWLTGEVKSVLRDSRLIDPVGGAVSFNQAGFGGSGVGKAVFAPIISIADFDGKKIHTFAVDPLRDERPPEELYPFTTPKGKSTWLFGSSLDTPGKPFMMNWEEII